MLQTQPKGTKFPEKKSLTESPDISDETSFLAEKESLTPKRCTTGDYIAEKAKVTEAGHLQLVDKLSQQEPETDAAISKGHLQRDEVPETQGDKGNDELKLSSSALKDSGETLQEVALMSGGQADFLKALEESVLHVESEIISEHLDNYLNTDASPANRDEDHVDKGLPADTNRMVSVDDTLDNSVSPKPSLSSEVEKEVTKQELHLSLDAAPGVVPSVYSKAKELLEECVGATDSTSPEARYQRSVQKARSAKTRFEVSYKKTPQEMSLLRMNREMIELTMKAFFRQVVLRPDMTSDHLQKFLKEILLKKRRIHVPKSWT
ncbi:hypothetical protein HPB51_008707 [Rhipicephalus microplus]|uniref:Uncharacterized protein n=1 Tax=Rhipicephalus microplus TaxID=6941 RepID=A0A9J6EZZ4_RHIMP|nr:hypothetical protein HPB51_008707 [Rhipicephalus microplus]